MIRSLSRAVGQLFDRRFRRVLLKGLGGTILLYILMYLGVGWVVAHLSLFGVAWEDTVVNLLGGLTVFVLTLLLFPTIATLVIGVLVDDIAEAVEEKYYPGLPPPRAQSWGEIIWGAVRFIVVSLAVNLVALPVYLLLLFLGVGALLYYGVNGYLLAREYFELAAWRRMEPRQADALRRAHQGRLWVLGAVLAFLSALPLINLVAPLIATAAMIHEVEALHRPAGR